MRVLFRREAEREFREAAEWYDAQRPGLGDRFRDAVDEALQRINRFPQLYPIVHEDARAARLRRFPYSVVYRVRNETLVVLAVFHASRDPQVLTHRR